MTKNNIDHHHHELEENIKEICDNSTASGLSADESNASIRDIFAVFLLLRWIDQQEAEQEALAASEDRPYRPLFPESLQWSHLACLDCPQSIDDWLHKLTDYVDGLLGDAAHPMATYINALAEPLRRVPKVNIVYLRFIKWVGALPFEKPSERRALLDVFDRMLAATGNNNDGQFATPTDIARLVAALANPKPSERIYDPCFGYGNFLVAAWQQAEQNLAGVSHLGTLLEVTGVEKNASTFLIGLTRMLLAGIDSPLIEQGNSLEREPRGSHGNQGFDVVFANPPLGVKIRHEPLRYSHFPIATNDSTSLFVQHALSQLKPNGRAVIVVPEGFLFSSGAAKELRQFLLQKGQIEAVIGLPAGAFAPYNGVKCSLLLLNNNGGHDQVTMVDASSFFVKDNGAKKLVIKEDKLLELVAHIRQRPNASAGFAAIPIVGGAVLGLGATGLGLTGAALAGVLGGPVAAAAYGLYSGWNARKESQLSMWNLRLDELENFDWDLTPRRREKGGLDELLTSLKDSLGESESVVRLSEVAEVFAGRSIKSADLLDKPPFDHSIGYIRIKDISHDKVTRVSSWLHPKLAESEQKWSLLPGDVLISKSGTIGKTALVGNGAVGAIAANGFYVIRADNQRLDTGYLLAYLASPACQNWLAAQSRGLVMQHLNRTVIDELLVPLPPLLLQAQAAAQYRKSGTDALAFLTQALGSSDSDQLTTWLAELDIKVPRFSIGLEDTPALSQFEPIVTLARVGLHGMDQANIDSNRWFKPLIYALLPLSGIAQIPAGSGLLNVLRKAESGIQDAMDGTTGHFPTESQAQAISERLRDWLRAAMGDLIDRTGLDVINVPASLAAGSFAEFSVQLENVGVLPLRNVRMQTQPDWGIAECSYLAEQGSFVIPLKGDVPKQADELSLRFFWQGRNLDGQTVEGEIGLAIRVSDPDQSDSFLASELGGSPYVTGSPLEPQHGHGVFFGREELIEKISRQIKTHGNVVLLEGNRRAGKTSILKHLEGRTAIPRWLAVYSSLQGAEGASQAVGVPTVEIFREIARSIATALTKLGIEAPLPNGQTIAIGKPALGVARACREGISVESPFSDFRDYLELVLKVLEPLSLGLLLMLDEFDKLQEGIDNGVTSPQVPENIRFLIQTYPKFSAILTGSRRLKRLREEYWSALFGLGTSIPVTVLDDENARKVVTEPVRNQLAFSQEAIERVIDITARHPYLMQCLCNRVFDYAVQTKSRSITVNMVDSAAHGLVKDNEHFASLWDYAGLGPETGRNRRQMILLLCARSFKEGLHVGFDALHEQLTQHGVEICDEALDADLCYLRELELIDLVGSISNKAYRLAIPLMADWIEQQQDAEVLIGRARTEVEEENV